MKLNHAATILGRILSNSSSKSSTIPMPSHSSLVSRFNSDNVYRQIRFFSANSSVFDFGFTRGCDRTIVLFQDVLEMHPQPRAFDFNEKLRSLLKTRRFALAFQLFEEMLRIDSPVGHRTLNIAIKCYCGLGRADLGFAILGFFFKRGDEPTVETFTTLIEGLLSVGEIHGAVKLWKKLLDYEQPCRADEASYNLAMIRGLCKGGHTLGAVELLRVLEKETCKPDVHGYTAVIQGLCKDGMVDDALNLFSSLGDMGISPNVFTYNSMMHGLCVSSRWSDVDDMLKVMAANDICPNLFTYNVLLDALCKGGRVEEAENMLGNMKQIGVQPNIVTCSILMYGYCLLGDMDKAENMLDLAVNSGMKPDIISYGTLMNGYCKMDRLDEVWRLFTKVIAEGLEHNVVSCNIMLHALFRGGRCEEGLKLFEQMEEAPQLSLVGPKDPTAPPGFATALLDGLCSAHRIEEAFSVLRTVEEKGITPNIVTYTTLITGLCNDNRVRIAKQLFQQLPLIGMQADVVTYNVLIGALCRVGETTGAKDLFVQMGSEGCLPNSITYNTFLRGLVKSNKLRDAALLMDEMKTRGFALDPTTSCVVLEHLRCAKEMMRVV